MLYFFPVYEKAKKDFVKLMWPLKQYEACYIRTEKHGEFHASPRYRIGSSAANVLPVTGKQKPQTDPATAAVKLVAVFCHSLRLTAASY